jgi:hypothetical protein
MFIAQHLITSERPVCYVIAMYTRVARWYVFKSKIPIWVNFGGPWNEKKLHSTKNVFPAFSKTFPNCCRTIQLLAVRKRLHVNPESSYHLDARLGSPAWRPRSEAKTRFWKSAPRRPTGLRRPLCVQARAGICPLKIEACLLKEVLGQGSILLIYLKIFGNISVLNILDKSPPKTNRYKFI